MRRYIPCLLLSIIIAGSVSGQNLITNSSFDEYFNYHDANDLLIYNPTGWYGAKYPVDTNKTSAGRQNNRRIEMEIIKK